MKNFTLFAIMLIVVGCSGNGPAHGEDVTAKIKAMPAEDRFKLIKEAGGMSPAMKEKAIDELPVSLEQKATWKADLVSQGK